MTSNDSSSKASRPSIVILSMGRSSLITKHDLAHTSFETSSCSRLNRLVLLDRHYCYFGTAFIALGPKRASNSTFLGSKTYWKR